MEAFLETVRHDECKGNRSVLFSVVHDKRFEAMAAALCESGLFSAVATAPLANSRAVSFEELHAIFEPYKNCEIFFYHTVEEAFSEMRLRKKDDDFLYVVGSLYLVGQIKGSFAKQVIDVTPCKRGR